MATFNYANGQHRGRTETLGDITYLYDKHGRLLASYNSKTNLTQSASGSTVLRENQLMTFLE